MLPSRSNVMCTPVDELTQDYEAERPTPAAAPPSPTPFVQTLTSEERKSLLEEIEEIERLDRP